MAIYNDTMRQVGSLPPYPIDIKSNLYFKALEVAKRMVYDDGSIKPWVPIEELEPFISDLRKEYEKGLNDNPRLLDILEPICRHTANTFYREEIWFTGFLDFFFGSKLFVQDIEEKRGIYYDIPDKDIIPFAHSIWKTKVAMDPRYENCSEYFWFLARNELIALFPHKVPKRSKND